MPSHIPCLNSPRPTVSVLMPIYNGAQLVRHGQSALKAALGSLLKQSFADFEILAVDDGSSDTTPEVLRAYAALDTRIRPIYMAHGGIVKALNTGLTMARGQYIARMDADDICHPHRLAQQVAYLDHNPQIGLVACRVHFAGSRQHHAGYARHVDWTNTLLRPEDIALHRFRESPIAHPSVMFRASVAHRYGSYAQGPFPEDYELWLRWLESGVAMAKLPETLLEWHDPPTRLSRTHPHYAMENFYRLKSRYLARWLACNNPHHPHVTIIGAGKTSRRRAGMLRTHGIIIKDWIDVDPRKIGNVIGGVRILGREAIPATGHGFCIAYLAGHNAAEALVSFLKTKGYTPGTDYLLAS